MCLVSCTSIYFPFSSLFPSLPLSLSPSLSIHLEPDQPFFETIARIRQAVGGPEEEISESMNVMFVFLINAHHIT